MNLSQIQGTVSKEGTAPGQVDIETAAVRIVAVLLDAALNGIDKDKFGVEGIGGSKVSVGLVWYLYLSDTPSSQSLMPYQEAKSPSTMPQAVLPESSGLSFM